MIGTYPPIISDLPQIDLPMGRAEGWLLQGKSRQAVFFRLEPGAAVRSTATAPSGAS